MAEVAVVTGAARGIGRAIATRLAAEGWLVVLGDLDADLLTDVASEIDGVAVVGDTSSEAGVRALVHTANEHYGPVDVFFANAGIGALTGLATSDAEWARVIDVNVMAHVRAARVLVPQWLERGSGRLVVTASAAGMLTMLGDAPYAVTKHAAVAFAEWLSATYRHRGIVVQALCPQGVDTRMLDDAGPLQELLTRDGIVSAEAVADAVWQALPGEQLLILPHPEVSGYAVARASHPDAWLVGMNKLQQRLERQTDTSITTPTVTPQETA